MTTLSMRLRRCARRITGTTSTIAEMTRFARRRVVIFTWDDSIFQSFWDAASPPIGEDDLLVTTQQLMHGTGMVASFPFLLLGLPQVVLPRFHAETLLEIIERHQVTTTFAVPGMLTRLADELDKRDRAASAAPLPLRRTLYGGAPLTPAELRRVLARVGGSLVQLYGRFEGGWPLAVLGQAEHARIAEGDDELATSCGRPIPHVETRLATLRSTRWVRRVADPQCDGGVAVRRP